MCLQRKKVQGVLRGAVRSASKRLAVHCIATPVLPLQRVFPQTMHRKQDRKLHSGLRQGQATRLSARCPAQRPATNWGRHTASPDALKTGRCKQTFTHFNVVPIQYSREKRFGASAKARRRAFRRIARPSVRREGKTLHFNFFGPSISYLSRWRGPRPLHRLQRRAPLRARGAVAPMRGRLLSPFTCKTQTVALQTDTHLCGYATRMWIPPIRC